MVTFAGVTKKYGTKIAVRNLSFSLDKGEILTLLGPNGAGKSTSMKMLTGYIPASAGEISVCGFSLSSESIRAQERIGYLPEGTPLYTEIKVIEFLKFAAHARNIPVKEQQIAISRVIEQCGLGDVQNQLIDTLSKGYRQRTCLAQSLIHDPDVIVMDEPTDGLDPLQKHEIQKMISEMGKTKSILLSTHIMEEAQSMADRILILQEGSVVAEGTLDELRGKLSPGQKLILRLGRANGSEVLEALKKLPLVTDIEINTEVTDDVEISLRESSSSATDSGMISHLVEACRQNEWQIKELKVNEESLKDLFRRATLKESRAIEG